MWEDEDEEEEYEIDEDVANEIDEKVKAKLAALRAIYGPPENYPKYTLDGVVMSTN